MTERTVWLEQAINPDRALSERQVSVPWCTVHDSSAVGDERSWCDWRLRYRCEIVDGVVWKVVTK